MATLQDYRDERLRKLTALRELGIDPYPAHTERTHDCATVVTQYDELAGQEVAVAGRVVSIRSFGKLAFVKLQDASGAVQLYLQRDTMAELDAPRGILGMKQLKLLDTGDFVEATGTVLRTKTGEISVGVRELRLLTKALRPMPEKLENKEERFRRRYVDMNVNPAVRQRFYRRSVFWQATRDYLNQHGFTEVNVPVLEHTTGGADANPWDWQQGMRFMEDMYKYVLERTFGTLQFRLGEFEVDMSGQWQVWDYAEVINKHYGIDVYNTTIEEVAAKLKEHGLEVEKTDSIPRGIDKLWKNIRKTVAGPVWLVNTPKFISPLSKTNPDNPQTVERFQPVIAGSELGNGFSELNDPIDQLNRFVEQQQMRDAGDEEAMMLDIDFVEMLEYGMPPACGWGFSERVFWIFEGVTAREGVPFPQLKSDIDETTRAVYPDIQL